MHAILAATVALAGTALAATSSQFRLHVGDNKDLAAWAIVNAHIAAGQNVIEIQRPSAYVSDISYLNGTATQIKNGQAHLGFQLNGVAYAFELVLPQQAVGQIGQVYAEPLAGNATFGVDSKNRLTVYGAGPDVFYACPENVPGDGETYTLWYGKNVKAKNLPSSCKAIELTASYLK